jgi:hypothetical protein
MPMLIAAKTASAPEDFATAGTVADIPGESGGTVIAMTFVFHKPKTHFRKEAT